MKNYAVVIGPVPSPIRSTTRKAATIIEVNYSGGVSYKEAGGTTMIYGGIETAKEIIRNRVEDVPVVIFIGFSSCMCCMSSGVWEMVVDLSKNFRKEGKKISLIDNSTHKPAREVIEK